MSVLVIGGGAAGMMAALTAAGEGGKVQLLEKNEKLGKKIYITGKGRCNLTNTASEEAFLGKVFRNPRFLRSAYSAFDNMRLMELFEGLGLSLKTERGGRVFPVSDKASDVIRTLEKGLKKAGVEICLHTEVLSLLVRGNRVFGVLARQDKAVRFFPASCVVLATGGLSYPSTGSTGDGYRLSAGAGHLIRQTLPSLVPLAATFGEMVKSRGIEPSDLMGLGLKNVALKLICENKVIFQEQGEMLFTHFGISGPLVLSASAMVGDCILEERAFRLSLDLKPALSREELEQRIKREQEEAGRKTLGSFLGGYLPRALIPVILAQSGLRGEDKAARLSKEERGRLVQSLKDLPLENIQLRDYAEAVITRGGVDVRGVEPRTMESRHIRGLYIAGELLDLDAATGGYNLQIAWTTGRAAGQAAGLAAGRKEETGMRKLSDNRHIAIDGPGSSGKSTIARMIARETGLVYVDTGAMYRGMAIYFLRRGLKASDEEAICAACADAQVSIGYEKGQQQIYLNGENVTALLREEKTGQMASASSVYAPVREKMKQLQQALAREKDVVMDGRDIGTVILPEASLKIYLTASAQVRARRRFEELKAKGETVDYDSILQELKERDERDMNRKIAPLKQAEDAVLIDSSEMSIEEVKDAVLALYGWKNNGNISG